MEHIVEYAHTVYGHGSVKSFQTQSEAVEFAESIMERFRCIWLVEWAEYQTGAGKWKWGYVYYWWSTAVTASEWGERPDAGYGRPARRKYPVPYRPFRYKSARFAHLNVRASPVREMDEPGFSEAKRTEGVESGHA
jgi:hypothetical protein